MAQSWDAALDVLLTALGMPVPPDTAIDADNLSHFLSGRGFQARRVALVNGVIPASEPVAGGLLEVEGGFLPVLGGVMDAAYLSPKGDILHAVLPDDLLRISHAWIIEDRTLTFDTITPFLSRYKGRMAELILAAVIVNLFALILPLFSSFVYDKILGNGITETLWGLVIGLCIVMLVEFCVRNVRVIVAERFAVSSEVDIDHGVFKNLLDVSANQMPPMGSLLEKYRQVQSFRDFLSSSYLVALADVPFLLLFLIVIFIASGPLVLVSLVCGALMLLGSLFVTAPVMDYDRQAKVAGERRFGLMAGVMAAREAVIGSSMRNELLRHWGQSSVAAATASSKSRYWRGFGMSLTNSVATIAYIAVLVGGVYMVEARQLTSGGLLAASMLTSRTMGGVSSIITLLLRWKEFRLALRELNQLAPPVRQGVIKSRGALRGDVRFENIVCRLHPSQPPVLNDLSLNIGHGEIVCIAGNPGAGKTTLLRLLSGVVAPEQGRILIDGIPLDLLSNDDLSLNMGVKPQDFCLFDGTIEENVRAGRTPMSSDERRAILETSGLSRAFAGSGLNWGSEVGPRGSNLSGGQRQLVSLARAMLRQPRLLLLDEPTNGLGDDLERHLAEQIARLRGHSTVIISTHCVKLFEICDHIIVLGGGKKQADGPRDEILRRG